jgi:hypothetical protein
MHGKILGRFALLGLLTPAVLLTACLGSPPGACTAEEAAAFSAISRYGNEELVPQAHPGGACADTLVTSDDPDAVIEHYRSAFEAAGYTMDGLESSPITDESGATVGRGVSLQASNASKTAVVSAEVFDGQEPTTFVVLVGDLVADAP